MNKFEKTFFEQYVNDDDKIMYVFHKHVVVILGDLLFWGLVMLLIPVWMYYTFIVKEWWFFEYESVPFIWFEIYLLFVWGVLMYKIFDWYNDAWIVTKHGIVDLEWSPLVKNTTFTEYENIIGIESDEKHWWDSFIKVSDLIIHKISTDMVIKRVAFPEKAIDVIMDNKTFVGTDHIEGGADKNPTMNIYVDGFKQEYSVKHGHGYSRYTPSENEPDPEETAYIERVADDEETIDLR